MANSNNLSTSRIVGYSDESRRYRRPLGGWWWAALIGVPLVLALIGTALFPWAKGTSASVTTPTVSASASASVSGMPNFALARSGNTVTMTGAFADEASRTAAVSAFKTAVGSGLTVVDQTTISAGAAGLSAAQATALGAAVPGIGDFNMKLNGSSLTLGGAAISDAAKAAAEKAVKGIYPSLSVNNMITVASPSASTTAATAATGFGLTRSGSTVTINGSFADEASRTAAVQAFKTAVGTGLAVVDQTNVTAGAVGLTAAQATALGAAVPGITDFGVKLNGTSLTLTGQAISDAAKAAAEKAAKDAYPSATITNSITVVASSGCSGLSSELATFLAANKLTFTPASPALTAESSAAVSKVAEKLKGCATAKVSIDGYTDNQGDDSTSQPLSQQRAETVRDALVAAGVTSPITATGHGSQNPVGDNNTDDGRAANRRVEITVS